MDTSPQHAEELVAGDARWLNDRLGIAIKNKAVMTVCNFAAKPATAPLGKGKLLARVERESDERAFGAYIVERLGLAHVLPEDEIDRRAWCEAGYIAAYAVNASGGNYLTDHKALRIEFNRCVSHRQYKDVINPRHVFRSKTAESTEDKFPERALTGEQLYAVCFFAKTITRAARIGLWDAANSPNRLVGETARERNADRKRRDRGRKALQRISQESIMEAVGVFKQHYAQGERIEQLLLDLRELLQRDITADEAVAYLQGFEDAQNRSLRADDLALG